MALTVVEAGLVPYKQAWDRQRALHAQRAADQTDDTVLLLEHPPVFTAGRRTQPWERPAEGTAQAPVVDVDRGGRITWHGPGQLVGYPILRLPHPMDVVAYVRRMEAMLIAVCADLSLATQRVAGRSGVWVVESDPAVADRKIAAIGVRVAKGVTTHGFALNCNPDLSWYDRIVACGIAGVGVTSLSAELARPVEVAQVVPLVRARLGMLLAADPEDPAGPAHAEGSAVEPGMEVLR